MKIEIPVDRVNDEGEVALYLQDTQGLTAVPFVSMVIAPVGKEDPFDDFDCVSVSVEQLQASLKAILACEKG